MEQNDFSLTNSPAQLQQLQRRLQAVLQAAALRPKVISAINLAVGEWIENLIQHAYADGESHAIEVQCRLGPADLTVQVTDDGRPFTPCEYPEMNATEASAQSAFSGRGIHLMRHLVDRMTYERQGSHNVLQLVKDIP